MGMTLRELVEGEEYCQGMANGKKFKAFAPSGPSGGFLPTHLKAPKAACRATTRKTRRGWNSPHAGVSIRWRNNSTSSTWNWS